MQPAVRSDAAGGPAPGAVRTAPDPAPGARPPGPPDRPRGSEPDGGADGSAGRRASGPATVGRAPLRPHVVAVLVACDGERWLPRTLAALAAQTRAPDAVVAVDAGSADASAAVMSAHLLPAPPVTTPLALLEARTVQGQTGRLAQHGPPAALLRVSRRAGLLDAARAALLLDDARSLADDPAVEGPEAAARSLGPTEGPRAPGRDWVWLLHDDGAPAPDALEQLLDAVELAPGVGVAGAKLLDWHDPRRLQQVGLTTTAAGRRLTGVERGDLDQGQRDDHDDVLAVSTAGMLVRRDLLTALGGDPAVPTLGEDLDLCQRARLAGSRVVVVPRAVVHHVDATRTGVRSTPVARRGARWTSRRHEVHRALVAAPAAVLPLVALAALLGGVLRALGRVSAKQPGRAPAEVTAVLAAVVGLLGPHRTWTARRTWRTGRAPGAVPARALAPLRAGPTETWRWHRDRWQRRASSLGASGTVASVLLGPPARVRTGGGGGGALAVVVLALAGTSLWALRSLLGAGGTTGPALPRAPELAALWQAVVSEWSPAGLGAPLPVDPVVPVLAALSLLAAGSPGLAITATLVLAVPVAGAGAWVAAGAVTTSRALRLLAALVWACAPPLLQGLDAGRLGGVLVHLALPWVALCLHRAGTAHTHRAALTAAAAAGLVAAVAVAGAPVLLPALLVVVLAVVVAARRHATALAWTLPCSLALLGPLALVAASDLRVLVADPGPVVASATPTGWALLLAHPTEPGPAWPRLLPGSLTEVLPGVLGDLLGSPALALVLPTALVLVAVTGSLLVSWAAPATAPGGAWRGTSQDAPRAPARAGRTARTGWAVAALGLLTAVLSARTTLAAPTTTAWPGAGTSVVLLGTALAALAVAERARTTVLGGSRPRRAGAAVVVVALAALSTAPLADWAAAGPGQLVRAAPTLPAVATDGGTGREAVRTLDLDLTALPTEGVASATLSRGPSTLLDSSAARTATALSGAPLAPATTALAAPTSSDATPATAAAPARGGAADPATAALAALTAVLAAGTGDPRQQLTSLGIGYVFVRGDSSLDGVQGLARAGATAEGVLYRVRGDAAPAPGGAGVVGAPDRPARARLLAADGAPLAVLASRGERVTAVVAPAEGDAEDAAPRRVVLAERDAPGWRATLDGAPLRQVLVDGWAVGFEVPATGGQLDVDYDGGPLEVWTLVQGVVVLLTVLLALPAPGRRQEEE